MAIVGALACSMFACSSGTAETSGGRSDGANAVIASAKDTDRVSLAGKALERASGLVAMSSAQIGVSVGELRSASLGSEIPVYFVSTQQLRSYAEGADPRALLGEPQEMIHPILVNGIAKAAVILGRAGGGAWEVIGIGRPKLAQSLESVRREALPTALVMARELGVRMAAHEDERGLMLTPLADAPEASLSLGREVRADKAFRQLVPMASRKLASL